MARQARRNGIILAVLTVLTAFTLALLLAPLLGIQGLILHPLKPSFIKEYRKFVARASQFVGAAERV